MKYFTVTSPTLTLKKEIIRIARKVGLKFSPSKAEFVICYGGDGSVLHAQHKYPELPKLSFKRRGLCNKCFYDIRFVKEVLRKVKNDKFKIKEEMLLEMKFKEMKFNALNEVNIRNLIPFRALRFSVFSQALKLKNLIGDGVIISTPFGSTGYFRSACGKSFRNGIGICLNNLFHPRIKRRYILQERDKIKVKIERELASLTFDNFQKVFKLNEKDIVRIKKSKKKAKFILVSL